MRTFKILLIFVATIAFTNCANNQKTTAEMMRETLAENLNMYVIEREIPGAGKLTAEELQAISQTSCDVLDKMGSEIKWVHSYVTADKIYCVYLAAYEEMVRDHAKQGGFPANSVSQVSTIIDPKTAE